MPSVGLISNARKRKRACCQLLASCNSNNDACAHPVRRCRLRSGSPPTETVELSRTTLNARKWADKGMHARIAYSHAMAVTLAVCVCARTRPLRHLLIVDFCAVVWLPIALRKPIGYMPLMQHAATLQRSRHDTQGPGTHPSAPPTSVPDTRARPPRRSDDSACELINVTPATR